MKPTENSTRTEQMVFDTYAIIEIIRGNENYLAYKEKSPLVTKFILAELAYNLTKYRGEEAARKYTKKYSQYLADTNTDLIIEAMKYRYDNKKRKLSMADCIGYSLAKELGIKFLTGDKQFKEKESVEFVK